MAGYAARAILFHLVLTSRFLDLRDEKRIVIYITRDHDLLERQHINHILETSFNEDQRARLHLLTPRTSRFFPAGTSMSRILYSCQYTLNKIKEIVGKSVAFIVPGIVGEYVCDVFALTRPALL